MEKQITNQELFLTLSFGKIYCKTWFPANANKNPPIILLHDSLGCVEMWRDFPEKLAEKTAHPVIAYDRLGFGKSSARIELPSIDFINDEALFYFPSIKQTLNMDHFILFGHSVGGAMALTIASQFKKDCLAVITESAQSFVEERTKEGILKAENDFFKNPALFSKLERFHKEKTSWVLDAWIKVWLSVEFSSWSLKPILPQVYCPTLILHGDQDEYGSTAFPNMIFNHVTGVKQIEIIPECSHVPHREKPNLILDLVSSFLLKTISN